MRAPKVIFDIVLLALYLVAANPALTGVPFHEYLGAGIFVLMVAHVVASGEGLGGRGRWAQRVLNGALLVALAFCVVSGAMVSGTLLPSLGFYATGYYFWAHCMPYPPRCCSLPCSSILSCARRLPHRYSVESWREKTRGRYAGERSLLRSLALQLLSLPTPSQGSDR